MRLFEGLEGWKEAVELGEGWGCWYGEGMVCIAEGKRWQRDIEFVRMARTR